MNLINEIVEKVNKDYNGQFICEQQKADLYVIIDNVEVSIESICTDTIYFDDDYYNVKLIDADVQTLAYINEVI